MKEVTEVSGGCEVPVKLDERVMWSGDLVQVMWSRSQEVNSEGFATFYLLPESSQGFHHLLIFSLFLHTAW